MSIQIEVVTSEDDTSYKQYLAPFTVFNVVNDGGLYTIFDVPNLPWELIMDSNTSEAELLADNDAFGIAGEEIYCLYTQDVLAKSYQFAARVGDRIIVPEFVVVSDGRTYILTFDAEIYVVDSENWRKFTHRPIVKEEPEEVSGKDDVRDKEGTSKGCGRVLGHGEYCVEGWLCTACKKTAELEGIIRELEAENYVLATMVAAKNKEIIDGLMRGRRLEQGRAALMEGLKNLMDSTASTWVEEEIRALVEGENA